MNSDSASDREASRKRPAPEERQSVGSLAVGEWRVERASLSVGGLLEGALLSLSDRSRFDELHKSVLSRPRCREQSMAPPLHRTVRAATSVSPSTSRSRWKEGSTMYDRGSWKRHYFDRESQETNNVVQSVAPADRDMFLEMQRARRSLSPKPCSYQDLVDASIALSHRGLTENVIQWLKQHGFNTQKLKELSLDAKTESLVEIDDVFICSETGAVHCCDDRCQEQLLMTGHKQCPFSGRTIPSFLISQEDNREDEGEEEQEEYGGRLGRAFAAGYGCSDEAELHRMWH